MTERTEQRIEESVTLALQAMLKAAEVLTSALEMMDRDKEKAQEGAAD